MTIRHWLESIGLERYSDAFEANDVDLAVASELTAEDLRELGVSSIGHRRKLLSAIAALAGESTGKGPPDLQTGGASEQPAADSPAERRQVTVLFADLVGYTRLSREVDSEDLHRILSAFFERVDSIVSAHGGSVNKHIGDCVMAVFGAPIAYDNDPERAALAALAIAAAMPELSAELGHPVAVHTGLASGQAIASELGSGLHRDFEVIGDTVNWASRLADRAGAGEILVSDTVHRMLPERARLEACPAGHEDDADPSVRVWRLIGIPPSSSDVTAPERPLVGRTAELRQLAGALAACRESGTGQTVLIRGEAGIGKSRLVEALKTLAVDEGFATHLGLVLDFGGGSGQDAIRSLVRGLLDFGPGNDASDADRAVEALGLSPDRRVFVNDLLGLPQTDELRRLYEAMENEARNAGKRETVAEILRCAAERAPRLLIVEDLHWADGIVLHHLAHLAATIADLPVVLAMTTRREGDPLDEAWHAAAGGPPLLTFDLGPLRSDDAERLAQGYSDRSADFVGRCIERAGGNPLFLEQLLRHGEESLEAGGVPGSIHSLVQARLDRLDRTEREAMQAASVLGQRFERSALEALLDRAGIDLSGLVSHLMLRRIEGGQFLFAHALIRDAVYDTLLTSRRTGLHRRAAEHFAGTDLPLRAEHLDQAGDPAAPPAYLEAAAGEAAEYRYGAARRLAARGLALAEGRGDRFDLACLLGEICQDLGAMADAAVAWDAALAAADSDVERCRVWFGQASVKRVTDDIDGALDDLARAEAVAVAHKLEQELARIHFLRGNLLFPRGDFDHCLREHGQSLEIARRIGSARLEAQALGGVGDAEYARGRMRTAEDLLRRCVDLARQTGQGRIEVANLAQIGHTGCYFRPLEGVARHVSEVIEACRRVGHARAELNVRIAGGTATYHLARSGDALEHFVRAEALARELGAYRFLGRCLFSRAQLARRAGRQDEALELAREGIRSTRKTGITFHGPYALAVLAEISPDSGERRDALAEGEEVIRAGCVGHNELNFYPLAMAIALDDGDFALAARHADALEAFTRPEPLAGAGLAIRSTRCLLAASDGRADAAEIEAVRTDARQLGHLAHLADFEGRIVRLAGPGVRSSQ